MTIRTGTADFYLDSDERWVAQDTETQAFLAFSNAYDRDRFVRDHKTFTYATEDHGYGVMGSGSSLYRNIRWDEPKHRIIWHTAWDGEKYYAKYEPLTGRRTSDAFTVEDAQAQVEFIKEVTVGGNSEWQYYEEEETPVSDYEKRYYDLLDALDAEAKRRDWCPQYDEFKKKNNVTDDRKPKYPFPTNGGAVIKVGSYVFSRNNHGFWQAHTDLDHSRTDEGLLKFINLMGHSGRIKVILEGA